MSPDELLRLAEVQREYVVQTRRHLHQYPELSFHERETAAFVAAELRGAGLEPQEGVGGGFGVVADLEGGRPGPSLALRADFDALPLQEPVGLPFRSVHTGVMHACGHDANTAILLATARALASVREQVPGRVRCLFQPAEELPPGGALGMIEAGCLEGIEAIFGLHQAESDAGKIHLTPGPILASADTFTLTVTGKGGHASQPEDGVDTIQVAANLVTALHQIVSRRVAPRASAVLTVGTLRGGTKDNILADEATLTGTIRALHPAIRTALQADMEAVARGVAQSWGAGYQLAFAPGYPVLVNDEAMTVVAQRAAAFALGPDAVLVSGWPPGMPGDDFARYLERVPGCLAGLGVGTPGSPERPTVHRPTYLLDEAALPYGVAWELALVFTFQALRDEVTGSGVA